MIPGIIAGIGAYLVLGSPLLAIAVFYFSVAAWKRLWWKAATDQGFGPYLPAIIRRSPLISALVWPPILLANRGDPIKKIHTLMKQKKRLKDN